MNVVSVTSLFWAGVFSVDTWMIDYHNIHEKSNL